MSSDTSELATKLRKRRKFNESRFTGLYIVVFGAWWLLRRMDGYDIVPDWIMTWPGLFLMFGFLKVLISRFQNGWGYFIMLMSGGFILSRYYDLPANIEVFLFPGIVMLIGLIVLFKPKSRKKKWFKSGKKDGEDWSCGEETQIEDSDRLETTVIFAGVKKEFISKNFKGGQITAVMGGMELNFSQSDIEESAVIDLNIVAGGMKLTVPRNWDVLINTTNVAGGVDDKRSYDPSQYDDNKTLILQGSIVLGGIEIVSF